MNEKQIVRLFKALGEPTRLKIIKLLSVQKMCVCELSEVLGMLQPRISQHLKILKDVDVVKEEKKGYWTFYLLNREAINEAWEELNNFLDADLRELEGYRQLHEVVVNLADNYNVKEIKEKLEE